MACLAIRGVIVQILADIARISRDAPLITLNAFPFLSLTVACLDTLMHRVEIFGDTCCHARVLAIVALNRFRLRPKPLLLDQPLPRLGGIGVIEVSDHRFRERLAENRHAVLPLLFTDHCEPFNIGVVLDTEL